MRAVTLFLVFSSLFCCCGSEVRIYFIVIAEIYLLKKNQIVKKLSIVIKSKPVDFF